MPSDVKEKEGRGKFVLTGDRLFEVPLEVPMSPDKVEELYSAALVADAVGDVLGHAKDKAGHEAFKEHLPSEATLPGASIHSTVYAEVKHLFLGKLPYREALIAAEVPIKVKCQGDMGCKVIGSDGEGKPIILDIVDDYIAALWKDVDPGSAPPIKDVRESAAAWIDFRPPGVKYKPEPRVIGVYTVVPPDALAVEYRDSSGRHIYRDEKGILVHIPVLVSSDKVQAPGTLLVPPYGFIIHDRKFYTFTGTRRDLKGYDAVVNRDRYIDHIARFLEKRLGTVAQVVSAQAIRAYQLVASIVK